MSIQIQEKIEATFDELYEKAETYLDQLESNNERQEIPVVSPSPVWLDTDVKVESVSQEKSSILDLMRGDVKIKSTPSRGSST